LYAISKNIRSLVAGVFGVFLPSGKAVAPSQHKNNYKKTTLTNEGLF